MLDEEGQAIFMIGMGIKPRLAYESKKKTKLSSAFQKLQKVVRQKI